MPTLKRKVIDNVIRIFDIGVMLLTFLLALYLHAPKDIPSDVIGFFTYKLSLINFIGLLVLIWGWQHLFYQFGLYEPRRFSNIIKESFDIIKAVTIGVLLVGALSVALGRTNVGQEVLVTFWIACSILTLSERWLFRQYVIHLRTAGRNLRHVVFVGSNNRALELAQKILSREELGYRLLGFVDEKFQNNDSNGPQVKILCSLEQLPQYLENHVVDEVFIVLPVNTFYENIRDIIIICQDLGIVCRVPSNWFEFQTMKTSALELDGEPILTVYTGSPHQFEYLWIKRLIDIIFTATAFLLLSPLFLIIASLIKITSSGPVLFAQERIGYNRRKFKMIKFRTMVEDAERMQEQLKHLNEADGPAFKIQDDPRITPVGRWLRRTSLDELPQLINVLRGDMSLVGPRPLPLRDVEGIEKHWQKRRFSMRPGLTCLWQIGGRNQVRFDEWMKLDLEYIDQWSIQLDFFIMAKTIPAVLKGTGQ